MQRKLFGYLMVVLVFCLAGCTALPASTPVPAPLPVASAPAAAPAAITASPAPTAAVPAATRAPAASPAATAPAAPATSPAPTAVQPPSTADNQLYALPSSCYREGLATFSDDQKLGLCFAYPLNFRLDRDSAGRLTVNGPAAGQGPEPLFALLTVDVRNVAAPIDLKAQVDEFVAQFAGIPQTINRKAVTVGGEPAVLLDPVPGRLSSRVLIVAHVERLYTLSFWPSFSDTPAAKVNAEGRQAQKDADALFEIVTGSLGLFPQLPSDATGGQPVVDSLALPVSCVVEGQPLYINTNDNYCFSFPPQFTVLRSGIGTPQLNGPALDASPDPLRAMLGMEVEVATRDATLAKLADAKVAEYAAQNVKVTRADLKLGGEPAVVFDGVPGRGGSRDVYLLRQGTLFHFLFQPDVKAFPKAAGDVEALYRAVTASFAFIPTAPAAAPAPGAAGRRSAAPFQGIGFSYPATLAQGTTGQVVPAQGGAGEPWWAISPAHSEVGLSGYLLPKTQQAPRIIVYPAAEFAKISPEAGQRIAALRDLLKAKPANPQGELPFLPLFDGKQALHFGVKYLAFQGGQAVRYLTQYGNGLSAINNQALFYTFQGLTADGRYYVAAILPVSHPSLPAGDVTGAELEKLVARYQQYLQETAGTLAAQPDATFNPGLADLDVLVQSITVKP